MLNVIRISLLAAALLAGPALAGESAATTATKTIDIGGNRIGYRVVGKGVPLIALTRLRGTLDTWDPLFLDELAKTHRVITVDYPGIGYSTGKLPPTIGATADFVGAFADAMHLDKFVLLGWSWGGTVAQAFFLDHPGRATHVVLIATAPPGKNPVAIQQAFLDRAFKPVNDLDDEIVLFFEPKSAASRAAARASRERIRIRTNVDAKIPSTPEEIKAYLAASADYREDAAGRRDKLTKTRTPILIISGDNDISTAVENWFALKGQIPNAQLIVYPETGHGPQHEYPALAAAQIALFEKFAIQE